METTTATTELEGESEAPLSIREVIGPGRLVPVLIGLMLGMLLAALDQTVVGTSLYTITGELHGFTNTPGS